MLDVYKIREDFPILKRKIYGKPLIYFDNTATTQRPIQVINTIKEFYENYNANIHRGVHRLSQEASELYEKAHEKAADFINAHSWHEIVFVRNTTEAINLIAYSWGLQNLKKGDEILTTIMEHHSNLVPWQLVAQKTGAKLNFVGINEDGTLNLEEFNEKINKNTKIVTVTHVSNVLGTINPIEEIGKIAKDHNALFIVDSAQGVPHIPVDVKRINCDFLAFSAHKMLGPTGIGVLYGKEGILKNMPPFLGGGDMIKDVFLDHSEWNDLPWKFEAGTSNVADGVGFGAAIDYLKNITMKAVRGHEKELTSYALNKLKDLDYIEVYGPPAEKRGGVISFNVKGLDPHDVAIILDREGIAVRSGHHCAQPLIRKLGVHGTARASFYIYNTKEEVDKFIEVLEPLG